METLTKELDEVRRLCTTKIIDSKLVTCTRELVRVEISKTKEKTLVAVLQFPDDYPNHEVLLQLRSKTLDDKLLDGLTKLAEDEARKYLGEPQIMVLLKLITKFLDENPLCCCAGEISEIRQTLLKERDSLRLKQKTSSIVLNISEGQYYMNCRIQIPHTYPENAVQIEVENCNFPESFCRVFMGHAKEIARKCVERPLNKKRMVKNAPPFIPKPSLVAAVKFLVQYVHQYPTEMCPACREPSFSQNPEDLVHDENHDKHVERILCGHLYHLKCLSEYMKTPPFAGGKKCLVCRKPVSHDKYKLTPELAEARWAHQQARQREMDEVVDFFS